VGTSAIGHLQLEELQHWHMPTLSMGTNATFKKIILLHDRSLSTKTDVYADHMHTSFFCFFVWPELWSNKKIKAWPGNAIFRQSTTSSNWKFMRQCIQ
jgi:hypothetical protein